MKKKTVSAAEYRERFVGLEVARAMIELRLRIIDRLGFDPGPIEQRCSRAMADLSSEILRPIDLRVAFRRDP